MNRELREACGNRSVLQIAQDVHNTAIGTFCRSDLAQADDVHLLIRVLDEWEPSMVGEYQLFDRAVRSVVEAALDSNHRVIGAQLTR